MARSELRKAGFASEAMAARPVDAEAEVVAGGDRLMAGSGGGTR